MLKITRIKYKEEQVIKPFMGRIRHWTTKQHDSPISMWQGLVVWGLYVDHPDFKGQWGHTSRIIKIDGPSLGGRDLETINARFVLVGPALTWDQYVTKRQEVEQEKHIMAYRLLKLEDKPKEEKKNVKQPYYSAATRVNRTSGRKIPAR